MIYARYHYNKTQRIAGRNPLEAMVNASKAIEFQVKYEQNRVYK